MIKNILFVCVENACRSQMAQGLANCLGGATLRAFSAGSRPADKVDERAVEVMSMINIDISSQKPKRFDALAGIKFDYTVALGCGERCPLIPAVRHIYWQVSDPRGKRLDFFIKVREELELKIKDLIRELKSEPKTRG